MRISSIMYHDIVESERWETSGFPGADADIYKLNREVFARHLENLKENELKVGSVFSFSEKDILITFDDGGESAYTHAADLLEKFGWRGHFFVATDFIDTTGFLKKNQIRELSGRGHIIGSHSASHPMRMSNCTREKMLFEWRESVKKLSDILGENVTVASVPGGHFSRQVAETAAESGIEYLFNSEPVTKVYEVENCKVFGRFTIQQSTSLDEFSGLAKGGSVSRFKQYALWNSKKLAKKIGGEVYIEVRKKFFER